MEILMDLCVLRSFESENHIFISWSLCVCMCFLSEQLQKTFTAETPNSVWIYICIIASLHLHHIKMLFETFYENRESSLYTEVHKSILKYYGVWEEFLVCEF